MRYKDFLAIIEHRRNDVRAEYVVRHMANVVEAPPIEFLAIIREARKAWEQKLVTSLKFDSLRSSYNLIFSDSAHGVIPKIRGILKRISHCIIMEYEYSTQIGFLDTLLLPLSHAEKIASLINDHNILAVVRSLSLISEVSQSNTEKASELYKKLSEIDIEAQPLENTILIEIARAHFLLSRGNTSEAIILLDTIQPKKLPPQMSIGIAKTLSFASLVHGKILAGQGQYAEALRICMKAEQYMKNYSKDYILANIFEEIANIYSIIGEFSTSLQYILRAGTIANSLGNRLLTTRIMFRTSEVYRRLGNWELAVEYGKIAAQSSRKLNNPTEELTYYFGLIDLLHLSKRHHEAEELLNDLRHENLHHTFQGRFLVTKARIAAHKKKWDEAEIFYQTSFEYLSAEREIFYQAQTEYSMMLIQQKRFSEAEFSLKSLLSEYHSSFIPNETIFTIHLLLSEIYEQINSYKEALYHHKLLFQLREKTRREEEIARAQNLAILHDIQQYKSIAEAERKNRRDLESQIEELTAEILKKDRTLQLYSKHISKNVPASATDHQLNIHNPITNTISHARKHINRNNFINSLEHSLQQVFPFLTPTQHTICVFLLSGYSTKEIASALMISPESATKQRYRIRTRLKLQNHENLEQVLREKLSEYNDKLVKNQVLRS